MSIDFTPKDTADAANALIDWLETQKLDAGDAVPVLLLALAGLIHEIADLQGLDEFEGGKAAGRALMAALKAAKP